MKHYPIKITFSKVSYLKNNKIYGSLGEYLAKAYYSSMGYKFVSQNFKTPYSEIDLIFIKSNTVYLIEVKLFTNSNYDVFEKWRRGQLPKLSQSYFFIKQKYPYYKFQINYIGFDFSQKGSVSIFQYDCIRPSRFRRSKI